MRVGQSHARGVCAVAAAMALLAVPAAPARAQGRDRTFELKLSHWVPASHPLHKALEDWGAAVEKDSSGTVKYKVFPSEQLGKAFDHYDMARDGIADLTYVNPGYQPGRFPIIAAGELPFLMSDAKGGSQALDAWYRKYDQMSAAQKKVIDDHCTNEWAGRIGGPWGEFEHDGIARIKAEPGHEVYTISADQLALWKKAAEPLEKTWSDNVRRVGVDPAAAMKELKEQLARYNAQY